MDVVPVRRPASAFSAAAVSLAAAGGLALCWLALVLLIFVRRAVGAIDTPLAAVPMLVTGVVAVVLLAVIRRLWQRGKDATQATSAYSWSGEIVCSALAVLLAIALSLPGTGAVGLAMLWTLIAFEEGWTWGKRLLSTAEVARWFRRAAAVPALDDVGGEALLQEVRTYREEHGRRVEGTVCSTLEAGQRMAHEHVAFCPPFAAAPQVEVEMREGPAAEIRTTQTLAHGARFEIKLASRADEPVRVVFRFVAVSDENISRSAG